MAPNIERERSFEGSNREMSSSSSSRPLPLLPVPPLSQTLDKLKKSAEPFSKDSHEYENLCKMIDKFGENDGVGSKLHKLLELKASKTSNWLSHDWWLRKAYLEGRDPIMVWSNPGLILPKIPQPNNSNKVFVYEFISRLILSMIHFRGFLKNGGNPEASSADPSKAPNVCMDQYNRIFGTCRIPGNPSDSIEFGNINAKSDEISIVISRMNKFYKLTLPNNEQYDDILSLIKLSIAKIMSDNSLPEPIPIGSFTALPRNDWSTAHALLNQNALKEIVKSEFVVCIDHIQDSDSFKSNYNNAIGKQILHADVANIGNRWYDKTVQLIVTTNSEGNEILGAGFCYEHTPAEAPPIVKMMEYAVKHLSTFTASENKRFEIPNVNELNLIPDANRERLTSAGQFSIDKYSKFINSLDLEVLEFDEYGKDVIKSLKYSPDSWIQVAISFAYYRVHGKFGGCYESASTRKFAFGRTDTIRSLTSGLSNFFTSPDFNKLHNAIESHKQIVNDAVNGQGIDRSFLGFNCIAQELKSGKWEWGLPKDGDIRLTPADYEILETLYKNELYLRSKHFNLSTSQVSTLFPNAFMCYGPLVNDGYGCCYNPTKNQITFAISAFKQNNGNTNVMKYKNELSQSLRIMRDIASKHSKL